MESIEKTINDEIKKFIIQDLHKEKHMLDVDDLAFFEAPLHFTAKDMLYLFHFVETNWNIQIEKTDIDVSSIFTLEGLVRVVTAKSGANYN